MNASEKLKALGERNTDAKLAIGAALLVLDALPQIVAVVEAVEEALEQDHGDGPPTMEIGRTLAALDEALS